MPFKTRVFQGAECLLVAVVVAVAIAASRPGDWHPLDLLLLLLPLSLVGDRLTVTIRNQIVSTAFVPLILAAVFLGPAPAIAIEVVLVGIDAAWRRLAFGVSLNNLVSVSVGVLVASLLVRAAEGDVHTHLAATRTIAFGLVVFGVFMVAFMTNFIAFATYDWVINGRSLARQARDLVLPLLPGQFAAAALAGVLGVAYANLGFRAFVGAVLVILIFQYLAVALVRSEDRAEQLSERSTQLATLQLGVLSTLMETLNLRDPSTARHAAAVAKYARDLAGEAGCDQRDQDLAHTAGLLHDIGKFAFPDRLLNAAKISPEDLSLVRRHPQDGAALVGRLDGYGPVSDVILYHHERIDGSGYPAGLIGREIPLLSRIVAICETYDTLTARDSYRQPVTPRDAFAEMRGSSTQLDADLVELFVAMLERDGAVTAVSGDHADFAGELDFERRARAIAQPAPTR